MEMTPELQALGLRLADRFAVADIELEATPTVLEDRRDVAWYDLRPMFDARRHCPEILAANGQSVRWALVRGLAHRHPRFECMVRLTFKDTVGP